MHNPSPSLAQVHQPTTASCKDTGNVESDSSLAQLFDPLVSHAGHQLSLDHKAIFCGRRGSQKNQAGNPENQPARNQWKRMSLPQGGYIGSIARSTHDPTSQQSHIPTTGRVVKSRIVLKHAATDSDGREQSHSRCCILCPGYAKFEAIESEQEG